jgi:tripartite-type tricarboxylate transporter receptor subunit TctC
MGRKTNGTAAFVIFSLVLSLFSHAIAAEFPIKPINLIVPWPAGGAGDIIGRTLSEVAKKELGQPIIVDNKPGAGGNIGTTLVMTKPPDHRRHLHQRPDHLLPHRIAEFSPGKRLHAYPAGGRDAFRGRRPRRCAMENPSGVHSALEG